MWGEADLFPPFGMKPAVSAVKSVTSLAAGVDAQRDGGRPDNEVSKADANNV